MIAIIEGIDRVGKTTLCKMLEEKGFLYFKDTWCVGQMIEDSDIPMYSLGKLDTSLSMLRMLSSAGINIAVDRLHLTELVYGLVERGKVMAEQIAMIDRMLGVLPDICLIIVGPTNQAESNRQAGMKLDGHASVFKALHGFSSIKRQMFCNYYTLGEAEKFVMNEAPRPFDFFFASPFFNPAQVEREEAMKSQLRHIGYHVYSPKEECFLAGNASHEDRQKVFDDNCKAIQACKAVFAITDGKDMGTIWEAGYAYGIKKPILYFAETLGDNPFNLMLAQSGKHVFRAREEVTAFAIEAALHGGSTKFGGTIE
jgi:nucleoside 2-deoxyribosyltransferase